MLARHLLGSATRQRIRVLAGTGGNGGGGLAAARHLHVAGDHPVLALDVPSGLELTTGLVHDPAVRATATLTLAAPKHGLDAHPSHFGALYLADISVPSTVLDTTLGATWSNPFGDDPLVRLERARRYRP